MRSVEVAAARGNVEEVLRLLGQELQADAVVVGLVEDGVLQIQASVGEGGVPQQGERLLLEESAWVAPLSAAGVRGRGPIGGVPLVLGEEVWGVLSVRRTTALGPEEVAGLREVAAQLTPHLLVPWLRARLSREQARAEVRLEEQAAGLYHDLINPIRHIQTLIAMLREDAPVLRGQPALYLDRIEASGSIAVAMIERMRLYAHLPRSEQGPGRIALSALIEARLRAAQVERVAEVSVSEALPAVWGDAQQIALLVDELLDNAIKFHRPGEPPLVRIDAHRLHTEKAWGLAIADQGIGFDMRYKERILLPFRRLHPPHAYTGFGLGLAICERIARLNGGRLQVWGEPGRGACFTLILPDVVLEREPLHRV